MTTTSTYSPRQLLEAARRAEANGQRDHASQFLAYLIQLYPNAPEAHEAREAMARFGAGPASAPLVADTVESRRPSRPVPQRTATAPRRRTATRVVRRYRLGRMLGRIVSLLGIVALVVGLTGFGAGIAASLAKANPLLAALALGPLVAGATTATGCALLLLAQMAGAVFDAASRGAGDDDDG